MRLIRYIIPAIAAAAFASCEKEIDFKYHDIPEQQVIECLLTQNGVSAKLTKTVATDEPFPKETVTDASVIITMSPPPGASHSHRTVREFSLAKIFAVSRDMNTSSW